MSVNNQALHVTQAIRNLALEEGADLEHHQNVAEVARELFLMKTERNAETKANLRYEANTVVQESQRKIRKARRLETTAVISGPIVAVATGMISFAIPILIPVAIAAASVATGTTAARSKINTSQEENKIWVFSNFPEAVRSPHIKKEAYKILQKEYKAFCDLEEVKNSPEYNYTDDEGENVFYRDEFEQYFEGKCLDIRMAKTAQINALHEHIERTFYS